MIEIHGTYGCAKVFTDTLEASAEGLIRAFCNQPYSADSSVRIRLDSEKSLYLSTTALTVKYFSIGAVNPRRSPDRAGSRYCCASSRAL